MMMKQQSSNNRTMGQLWHIVYPLSFPQQQQQQTDTTATTKLRITIELIILVPRYRGLTRRRRNRDRNANVLWRLPSTLDPPVRQTPVSLIVMIIKSQSRPDSVKETQFEKNASVDTLKLNLTKIRETLHWRSTRQRKKLTWTHGAGVP